MSKNLYEVLGVNQDATQADIDTAYASLLAEYQVRYDKGEQDAQTLIFNLKGTHDILTNPQKRVNYDESLARNKFEYEANQNNNKSKLIDSKKPELESKHTIPNKKYLFSLLAIIVSGLLAFYGWQLKEKRDAARQTIEQLDELAKITSKWDSANALASSTSRIALSGPVQKLQDIYEQTESIKASGCTEGSKKELLKYMDLVVSGYLAFMRDRESLSSSYLEDSRSQLQVAATSLVSCKKEALQVLGNPEPKAQ